jgi:hypothetical protein
MSSSCVALCPYNERVNRRIEVHLRCLIRESRHGHTHSSGTDETREENEQVGMWDREIRSDFRCNWDQQYTGNGMADKGRDYLECRKLVGPEVGGAYALGQRQKGP